MSHITKIQTHISSRELLLQTLTNLGYEYQEGQFTITGHGNSREEVEILVPVRLSNPIGFKVQNGKYEIIADWWGMHGIDEKRFTQALLQKYAYCAARQKMEAQGFSLVEEQHAKNGQIRLVLRRMV